MAVRTPWWRGEGFRAALLSLILLGVILGVWHLATLPKVAAGPVLTPEQIEYMKLMGKDPAAQSGGGNSSGFWTPLPRMSLCSSRPKCQATSARTFSIFGSRALSRAA